MFDSRPRFRSLGRALVALAILAGCSVGGGPVEPDVPLDPGDSDVAAVLSLTNQHRTAMGLTDLELDSDLSAVARAHARDMAERGYFAHTTPDGVTFADRLAQAGYTNRHAGENIAGNHSPEGAVRAWMQSSGHRANILGSRYRRIGIGVYERPGDRWIHYVQVFMD